jgi:hypothetical protein
VHSTDPRWSGIERLVAASLPVVSDRLICKRFEVGPGASSRRERRHRSSRCGTPGWSRRRLR